MVSGGHSCPSLWGGHSSQAHCPGLCLVPGSVLPSTWQTAPLTSRSPSAHLHRGSPAPGTLKSLAPITVHPSALGTPTHSGTVPSPSRDTAWWVPRCLSLSGAVRGCIPSDWGDRSSTASAGMSLGREHPSPPPKHPARPAPPAPKGRQSEPEPHGPGAGSWAEGRELWGPCWVPGLAARGPGIGRSSPGGWLQAAETLCGEVRCRGMRYGDAARCEAGGTLASLTAV